MSHVPRDIILEENYKNIVSLNEMLDHFRKLLDDKSIGSEVVMGAFMPMMGVGSAGAVGYSEIVGTLRKKLL